MHDYIRTDNGGAGSIHQELEIVKTGLDVQIEKGVLTLAGERKLEAPAQDAQATIHIDERYAGRFRRVVTLPDDIDANAVQAKYRDGVLHISIPRREAAQPRRISIQ